VAQLQGAASAASGLGRPSMLPVSGAGSNQSMSSLAGVGGMLQGGHTDLNKRGPVEFNHAIRYVNKIKVCLPHFSQSTLFTDNPCSTESFLVCT
jgi:paired amphipathic helix protein Sin3a